MSKIYTVLLADDDPDYLFQVAYYLRKAGFEVMAVESQAEAEQVIAKAKPDI
ncbi:response regulator, partial [bacterium]|nr:response regulator [bacterium]